MARLSDNLDTLRLFIAEAAHQLRTPLAALHAQMEPAGRAAQCGKAVAPGQPAVKRRQRHPPQQRQTVPTGEPGRAAEPGGLRHHPASRPPARRAPAPARHGGGRSAPHPGRQPDAARGLQESDRQRAAPRRQSRRPHRHPP
ncbi:hypothetical protein G6F22_015756 [Rhizopus arrhizus]|nr:hypothetical protein G6F22_015756 [Rhizopus arrhizus]